MRHPILQGSPYQSYVYAYPHKTAYRPFDPPLSLRDVWNTEPHSALFLYLHVPFCTMRCGFCNLFTTAKPSDSLVSLYLDALERQASVVRGYLPDASFARFAIGGGTPTYLGCIELNQLLDLVARTLGTDLGAIPGGIEVSPDTITREKATLLKSRGIERVSIGVQSFLEAEAANSGRPQSRVEVDTSLQVLREEQFQTLNIDLIYGLPGQTVESWLYSLTEALRYEPEELYLYPLYVRPLTGLGRSHKTWDDIRLSCYREARAQLLASGYEQVSMRMFRRVDPANTDGPAYCVQDDGMVGLGCGARSYTRATHYSLDYAVTPKSVKAIITDYLTRDRQDFALAENGFVLNIAEQKRRYLLYTLLNASGLNRQQYRERFQTDILADFPDLCTLIELGLFQIVGDQLLPTSAGLERSDAIGPWFYSDSAREQMEAYELR